MTPDELGREAGEGLSKIESEASALAGGGYRFLAAEVSTNWAPQLRVALSLLAVILVASAGAWLAVKLTPRPVPEVITPASAVVQSDGSQVVQRSPDAHPKPPPHVLPKGAVEERRDTFVAAPAAGASSVQIDLSLVRMPDNGRRVVASSPDGTIVSALDVPIEPGLVPSPPKKWAAGLSYSTEREVGVWLERDVGRLRLGAEVSKGQGKPRAELRVGVAF